MQNSLECTRIGHYREKLWLPLQVALTFMTVLVSFVIFRCDTLPAAFDYLLTMFGMGSDSFTASQVSLLLTSKSLTEISAGIVFALPVYPALCTIRKKILAGTNNTGQFAFDLVFQCSHMAIALGLFYFSCISLAAGVYNPFIYFRF